MRAAAEASPLDFFLFLTAAGAAVLAACFYLTGRRIQWEKKRGLYTKQSHAFYWSAHDFLQLLWLRWPARVALAVFFLLLLAALLLKKGPDLSSPVKREMLHKDSAVDIQQWLLGLEAIKKQEGQEAYCRKIRSEMGPLTAFKSPRPGHQAQMRYLSREWVRACERS